MGFGGIKIDFNPRAIKAGIEKEITENIAPLMEQVLKDSNYFCRQDQKALINSSMTASRPKEGVLIWNTPYARRVYYTGKPSKDKNQNASLMWFHKAKERFGGDWNKLAKKLLTLKHLNKG
jgi:hypothetical protein